MRFGIEVEFRGSQSSAIEALRGVSLTNITRIAPYDGHDNHQWVIKSDASVSGGGEMVSPPLDFNDPEQRAQVTTAVDAIREAGCTPCDAAGIHVHVESSGMTAEQLSSLVRTFTHFEDVLYRLATSGWQGMRSHGWTYCKPLLPSQKERLARAKSPEALANAYYTTNAPRPGQRPAHSHGDRYYGLNLHSHFYRGTVEFRIFNSSMNAMRVQTYVAICHALLADAQQGKKRSIKNPMALGKMAAGELDEKKALFQFLSVMRYQAGMSLEDYRNVKALWKDSVPLAAPAAAQLW